MEKNCVNCGKALPEEASFCPYCMAPQREQQAAKPLKRWRRKAVIALAAVLMLCLAAGVYLFAHRPQVYTAEGSLTYDAGGERYDLVISFFMPKEDQRVEPTLDHHFTVNPGDMWQGFSFLCAYKTGGGIEPAAAFLEQVEQLEMTVEQLDDRLPLTIYHTAPMEDFAFALQCSLFAYTSECGSNRMTWHLTMKNGDEIYLSHQMTVHDASAS